MMNFETNQGAWFEYVPGQPKQGRCKIRVPSMADLDAIYKTTRKKVVEFRPQFPRGPLQRLSWVEVDENAESDAIFDHGIMEWEKTGLDGVELDCTKENKIRLLTECPAFLKFYRDSCNALNEDIIKRFGGKDPQGN